MIDQLKKVEKLTELYYILSEFRYIDEDLIGGQISDVMSEVKSTMFDLSALKDQIEQRMVQGEDKKNILLEQCPEFI